MDYHLQNCQEERYSKGSKKDVFKARSSFKILFILLLFLTKGHAQTFTTSGTYVVPAGVTYIYVECIGGGGGRIIRWSK